MVLSNPSLDPAHEDPFALAQLTRITAQTGGVPIPVPSNSGFGGRRAVSVEIDSTREFLMAFGSLHSP